MPPTPPRTEAVRLEDPAPASPPLTVARGQPCWKSLRPHDPAAPGPRRASPQARSRKSSFGLLLDAETLSTRTSLALLLSRLLIAVLFLFVGLSELHRLLFQPFTPYLPGDGHDVVWPKAVELLLAIPFTLGFKTTLVHPRRPPPAAAAAAAAA